jgi:tetratricopeptide (TPR) repeat protein
MSLLFGAVLAFGGGGWSEPAWAGTSDPRLDGLFQQLRAATDQPSAVEVEDQIWEIWLDHPDEEVLVLMQDGVSSMNEEHYPQALQAFDAVIDAAPDYAEGWNKRANVYYLMGDYPAAIADISHVLTLEPRHFAALVGLGLICMEMERPDGALKAFSAAFAINPQLVGLQDRIANLQRQLVRSSL